MAAPSIAVVYRVWKTEGETPSAFWVFKRSYESKDAQCPHELILCEAPGLDIAAYLFCAATIPHEFICFVGSYTTIESDGWLHKLYTELNHPEGVGLVGAMGSFESMIIDHYPPFPNPHIRTNGFMIRRELLLSLGFHPPQTKMECYEFESGPRSLTRRVLERGLKTLIVGANGVGYDIPEWPFSKTFRLDNQENLLIHDRHTRLYANATPAERYQLRMHAWREATR